MMYSSEERAGRPARSAGAERAGGGYSRQIDCAAGDHGTEADAGPTGRGRGTPERDPWRPEQHGDRD